MQRRFKVVVHNNSIKFTLCLKLILRSGKAALDRLLGIGATAANSALKLLKAGGGQENLKTILKRLPHLSGSLQFDLKQHGMPCLQLIFHRLTRRAVAITCKFRPLQQSVLSNEIVETLSAVKEITHALLFPLPRSPGGSRYRQPHLGMPLQQSLHQGALSDSAGASDHRELAGAWHQVVCIGQQSRKPSCPIRKKPR